MNKILRKLANSTKWQNYYARCKEIGTFQLFYNVKDLTSIQSIFLSWLEIYSSLYNELSIEKELLDEEVINDIERCDAYLVYKRKYKNKKTDKKKRQIDKTSTIPSMRFRRKA